MWLTICSSFFKTAKKSITVHHWGNFSQLVLLSPSSITLGSASSKFEVSSLDLAEIKFEKNGSLAFKEHRISLLFIHST